MRWWIVTAVLLFWQNPVLPQGVEWRVPGALLDLWKQVEARNLTLQETERTLQGLQLDRDIQSAAQRPMLSLISSYNHVSEIARFTLPIQPPGVPPTRIEAGVHNQYDAALVVQQPVFTGFRLRSLAKAAEHQWTAARWQLQRLKQTLFYQTGQLYYQLQLNLLQQRTLEIGIQRIDVQRERVRSLWQAQQATAFDTLEVYNRGLQLKTQLQQLKAAQQTLELRLRLLTNNDGTRGVSLAVGGLPDTTLPGVASFIALAKRHRPELKELEASRAAQAQRIRAARSAYYPQVLASATYHYAKPGVNFFANEWMTYYTAGIQLQWRLWTWGQDQKRAEQARIQDQALQLRYERTLREIEHQVREAWLQLRTAAEQLRLQSQLVDQERQRYQRVSERFEQGQAALLDLRDAESRLTEAELVLQQRTMEWYQFRLQLMLATGQIGPSAGE